MGTFHFTPWKMATMATLCLRTAVRGSQMVSSRAIATSTIARKEFKMQEPLDHATGVEKWELLAKQQGNDDPFLMKMGTRGKGTKADPNIVDSFDSYRFVGCCCQETPTSNGSCFSMVNPKDASADTGSNSKPNKALNSANCLCR